MELRTPQVGQSSRLVWVRFTQCLLAVPILALPHRSSFALHRMDREFRIVDRTGLPRSAVLLRTEKYIHLVGSNFSVETPFEIPSILDQQAVLASQ